MSTTRSLLFTVLIVALALLSLASPAFAQVDCEQIDFAAYSVTARDGSGPLPGQQLANLNTSLAHNVYNVTLDPPNTASQLYVHIQLATDSNATFTLTFNGATNRVSYPFSLDGTTVLLRGYHVADTNIVEVNITQHVLLPGGPYSCNIVDVFYITNVAGGGGGGGGDSSSGGGGGDNPTGGYVVGDPQFVGLRGQSFQVHGMDGAVYALISDESMQLNARFTYLDGPRPCPVMPSTGKRSACWSHAGSYMSEMGLLTSGGQRLSIQGGRAHHGFLSVTLDDQPLTPGQQLALTFHGQNDSSTTAVQLLSTHELVLHTPDFTIHIDNSDHFVNLAALHVRPHRWQRLAAHGLLGQTWQQRRYSGSVKEIEGEVDDYVVTDNDLFGTHFVYNRFGGVSKQQ